MPEGYNINGSGLDDAYSVITEEPVKTGKSKGCSCVLLGCLLVLFLGSLPFIGGGYFLSTIDDAVLGEKIIYVLKEPAFATGIKNGIKDLDNMSEGHKTAIIDSYDKFLQRYDQLSPEDQNIINKNIYVVIKKMFTDPEDFDARPPLEFIEILAVLHTSPDLNQTVDDITADIVPDAVQDTGFDIPINMGNTKTIDSDHAKPAVKNSGEYKTKYDF